MTDTEFDNNKQAENAGFEPVTASNRWSVQPTTPPPRGLHKSSIRQGDVDGVFGKALVYDVCVDSSKIVGSASISYGCG
jgi:hypothetical protein